MECVELNLVDRFLPVLSLLERDLSRRVGIEEIAQTACYSRYHAQRLFKAVCGRTIGEYLFARRMTRASEILLYSRWDFSRIADEVGYESERTFRNAFISHFGMTPFVYRKQGQEHWHRFFAPLEEEELLHIHSGGVTLQPNIKKMAAREYVGYTALLPMDSPEVSRLFHRAETIVPTGLFASAFPRCFVWGSSEERLARIHHFAVVYERSLFSAIPEGTFLLSLKSMRVAQFYHRGPMSLYDWSKRYIWQKWNRSGEWMIDEDQPVELGFRFEKQGISSSGFEVMLPLADRQDLLILVRRGNAP